MWSGLWSCAGWTSEVVVRKSRGLSVVCATKTGRQTTTNRSWKTINLWLTFWNFNFSNAIERCDVTTTTLGLSQERGRARKRGEGKQEKTLSDNVRSTSKSNPMYVVLFWMTYRDQCCSGVVEPKISFRYAPQRFQLLSQSSQPSSGCVGGGWWLSVGPRFVATTGK